MLRFFILAFILASSCIYHSTAQNDTVRKLPEVEVVGRRTVSASRHSAPLQIIDSNKIERLGISNLYEAVRQFSGVSIKDYGGIGGLKTVSIRSLGAQHTAVSYDGVAITDAQSGQVDISRFTIDNVAMISLSAGQADDIFQTARLLASAGTLNITTLKPQFSAESKYNIDLKLKSGSFGLLNPLFSGNYKISEKWSLAANADYMRADGQYPFTLTNGSVVTRERRLNSDIETVRAEATLYGSLGKNDRFGSLTTKIYMFDSERGLPGAVNLYNRVAAERLWNDLSFIQTKYNSRINNILSIQGVGKYSYSYSRYKDVNENYSVGFQEDKNTEQEWYGSVGLLIETPVRFSITNDFAYTTLDNNFVNAAQPSRNTSLTAFVSQYKTEKLTATGSMLYTFLKDEVSNGKRPDDRKRLSPALSLSWQPFTSNTLRLRASYKDIFRVPTFADLYYLRIGNTSLKPEKAVQYNAGMTWNGNIGILNYLSVTADAYYNSVEDKIVALPTLYIWKMMNMGKVRIKGIDVNIAGEMRISPVVCIYITGNYTYQNAIDVTNMDSKNYRHQIPYAPRHTVNGSVSAETPFCNVSYMLTAVGKRYMLPQNIQANIVDGYLEHNVSLNRTFQLRRYRLRLQGELLNVANTQYEVIRYYPMPGRSWRLSISLML